MYHTKYVKQLAYFSKLREEQEQEFIPRTKKIFHFKANHCKQFCS